MLIYRQHRGPTAGRECNRTAKKSGIEKAGRITAVGNYRALARKGALQANRPTLAAQDCACRHSDEGSMEEICLE